ncbi:hypothetical protein BDW42DRAFT_174333 [Aspergillus taichungensis]|uniref:Uncharacterized protein n=1 Tax=Aspergillus taichungensis TaxID=482145 RepID=A0A2J5HNI0_9EURO|nr:hypothetical protein BDW42DRAFT_174333 [Aspergillus taichungensis]
MSGRCICLTLTELDHGSLQVPLCVLCYWIETNKFGAVGFYESMLEYCPKDEFVAMADRTSNYASLWENARLVQLNYPCHHWRMLVRGLGV